MNGIIGETGLPYAPTFEELKKLNEQTKQWASQVASILTMRGFSVTISWDPQPTSGPYAVIPLTGVISASKGGTTVESVIGLTQARQVSFNADAFADYIERQFATTYAMQTGTPYARPEPVQERPGVMTPTVSRDEVSAPQSKGEPAPQGTYQPSSAPPSPVVQSTSVLDQVRQYAASQGYTLANWDQWNWFYRTVTGLTPPAPEDRGFQRDAQGRVLIQGRDTYPIEVWYRYAFEEKAPEKAVYTQGVTQPKPNLLDKLLEVLAKVIRVLVGGNK